VSIRLLNCHTRNPSKSCISRSTSQSHSLSDSISQRASLFTYHLVRAGYSPVPSSRFTLITWKTLVSSPTDYASSGLGSERRTDTYAELATDPTQLTSSRACHRHVTRDLAGNFYKSLFSSRDQDAYYERSARALQDATRKLRRKEGMTLERWVNFVHYGA
jgi:hypothetical protein